jgi:hypothetical protein
LEEEASAEGRLHIFPESERKFGFVRSALIGARAMASTTGAFVMGIGTTFAILAAGFGSGLLFGKNTMDPTPPAQSRTAADGLPPSHRSEQRSAATADNGKKANRVERRRSELEDKQRRQPIAEHRAKRDAARIAKRMQQQELQPQGREQGILAFDDEQPPHVSRGLFGN